MCATYDTGSVEELPVELLEVAAVLSAVGQTTATVSYGGKSVAFTVSVHEGHRLEIPKSDYPESDHVYANSIDETKEITISGAEAVVLSFSKYTYTGTGDFIYVYDGDGNQLACYQHNEAAGRIVKIPGDTVRIRLITDSTNEFYGYSFDQIYGLAMTHEWISVAEQAPTCTEPGCASGKICEWCGEQDFEYIPPLGHDNIMDFDSSTEGIVYTCRRCGTETIERYITSGTDGGSLTWKLSNAGTLVISGTGAMNNFFDDLPLWYEYREVIKTVVVDSGVSTIGEGAFSDLPVLQSVIIGENVKSIGAHAFSWSAIQEITLPDGITSIGAGAFSACQMLKKVVLPKDLQSIGDEAFYFCDLRDIVIPDSVKTIGTWAFTSNENLVSVVLPNELEIISEGLFHGCVTLESITIPNSVTIIGDNAFASCINLKNADIPAGVTEIGFHAFAECFELREVILPEGITSISGGAFSGCAIEEITIPDGVTEIGEGAFSGTQITSLVIPSNVSYIGHSAFQGCELLSDVTILSETLEFGYSVFQDCTGLLSVDIKEGTATIASSTFENCTSLMNITLPSTLKTIEGYAFRNCKAVERVNIPSVEMWCNLVLKNQDYGLESTVSPLSYGANLYVDDVLLTDVIVPDSITEIREFAFYGCESITSIRIPGSVTKIGQYAFTYCSNLEEVELCDGIQSIETYAFYDCINLLRITLPDSISNIGECSFRNCASLEEVHIPTGVTAIEKMTFRDCESIQTVLFHDEITSIGEAAFWGCHQLDNVNLPTKLVTLGLDSFRDCQSLSRIAVPSGVSSLPHRTFYDCYNLSEVLLYDGLKTIGNHAFKNCYKLKQVLLPEGLETIGKEAFVLCSELKSLTIPKSVTDIGLGFASWSGIRRLVFTGSVPYGFYDRGNNILAGMRTTVYAPLNDATWDLFNDINYVHFASGDTTWVRYNNVDLLDSAEFTVEEGKTVSVHASAALDTFSHVTVDGITVLPENYSTMEGSTIVTFYPSFLETLSKGDHAVAIHFEDGGIAFATITVENMISHEWGDWEVYKETSCAAPGEERMVCSRCGYYLSREIVALEHSLGEWAIIKSAVCTETGELQRSCKNCDYAETEVIPATGHTEAVEFAVMSTCTETGLTEGVICSVCKEILVPQEVVPALGHDFSTYVSDNNATCTKDGTKTAKCERCDIEDTITDSGSATGHSYGTWEVNKPVTCTEDGKERRDCVNCDHYEIRTIEATGHDYKSVATSPTCTERGYTTHACSKCGDSYVDSYVNATGHKYGNWTVTKEATCTEDGTERRDCQNCDHYETRTIEATGHDYKSVVTAPTCTEKGYTTHTCANCGHNYVDTFVPALGHNFVTYVSDGNATCTEDGTKTAKCERCDATDTVVDRGSATGHKFGDWFVFNDAICTKDGLEQRDCQNCDHYETRVVEATGHSYKSVVTAPTCTEQGYTTHTCANCGHSYIDSYVNATGHKFGNWTTTKEATCTEDGEERRDCQNCDHYETRTIEATGHNYKSVVTAPTCTEQGYTTHTCANCGDSYADTYVSALGHSYGAWYQTKAPTYESEGEERRDCDRCDEYQTRVIPMLKHEYVSVVTEPTCTEQGYTTHTCTTCGDTYVDTYVPALGHNFVTYVSDGNATCTEDGTKTAKCERCDATDTVVDRGSATGHKFGNWFVTKAATCTEDGQERRDCQNCDHYETRTNEATGHNYKSVVTAPTCTECGYTTHTCSVCSHSYIDSYVDAIGHKFGNWTVTKAATCTEDGQERRDCENCDHHETRTIEATGHNYKSMVTAPTCTEKGYTTHTCSNCDHSYMDSYVDATGHKFGPWEVVTEPEAGKPGLKQRMCEACEHIETEEIPALDIVYGDANGDGQVNGKDLILLRQALAGWDVTLDEAAADCNGDGTLNGKDLILLRQALAGWDVTLGPTPPIEETVTLAILNLTFGNDLINLYNDDTDGMLIDATIDGVRKVSTIDVSVLATVEAALNKSGLLTLDGDFAWGEETDKGACFYVAYTDGTSKSANYEGVDVPDAFVTGYAIVKAAIIDILADVPEYIPQPEVIGEMDEDLKNAALEIVTNSELSDVECVGIMEIKLDEAFAFCAGLSSDEGISAGVQAQYMLMRGAVYSLVIVKADDTAAVAADFEANLDWNRWVSVRPSNAIIATKGDMVLCLMSDSSLYAGSVYAIQNSGWTTVDELTDPGT